MTVTEVETDIMASLAASPIGQAVILVIMYVETFKTVAIIFIGNVKMHLMSRWLIIFSIRVSSFILTISLIEIKVKVLKLPKKLKYFGCGLKHPQLYQSMTMYN